MAKGDRNRMRVSFALVQSMRGHDASVLRSDSDVNDGDSALGVN